MKKILALLLCIALLLALSGCGAVNYKAGNYAKALEIYEKQGNTEYVNKCRFMLLYEHIIAKDKKTESGSYILYDSYLSNTGGISLYADPKTPGIIQVLFYIQEDSADSTLNYDVTLFLSVDDSNSAFYISRAKTTASGNTFVDDAQGKVDIASYTAGSPLTFDQSAHNVASNTVNSSSGQISESVQKEMCAYFSLAIDSLHEFLQLVDMGTTVNHLGFDAWEYVE